MPVKKDATYWKRRALAADQKNAHIGHQISRALEAERQRIVKHLEAWLSYYPEDVFPPPEPGCAPDRYSAGMARHLLRTLIKDVTKARYR